MKFLHTAALALVVTTTGLPAIGQQDITCGQTYTVAKGDTLSRISKKAYGSHLYQPIYAANVAEIGTNPNRIIIGQKLTIPCIAGETVIVADVEEAAPKVEVADLASGNNDAIVTDVQVFTFSRASAPPFIINSGIIDKYLAEIAEVTEGRVTFIDPKTVNRDHSKQFDLVTSGEVDGAYVLNTTIADTHPLLQLPMNPMFGGSAEQTATALWRLHDAYLSKTDYFTEAEVLGFVAAPAAHIWRSSTMPITAGENIAEKNRYYVPYFSGLDTRGPDAMRNEFVQNLLTNYNTSSEPPTFFFAHGAVVALGVRNAGQNMAVVEVDNGLYTPTFSVVLSNEAWAKISLDDQEAIRKVSGEALSQRSAAWDGFDNAFRAQLMDSDLDTRKADQALINELWSGSVANLEGWQDEASNSGVPSEEALNFYLENLHSLQNRLIYRGDETYIEQNPFKISGS